MLILTDCLGVIRESSRYQKAEIDGNQIYYKLYISTQILWVENIRRYFVAKLWGLKT